MSSTVSASSTPHYGKKRPAESSLTPNKRKLRDFSYLVCQTVQQHPVTSFAQVADALVHCADTNEANIRRRVYDCLNVLLGAGVLARDASRRIVFRGTLPPRTSLAEQRSELQHMITQLVCWRNLMQRNAAATTPHVKKLPLPFIVMQTDPSAVVQCRMSLDLETVVFDVSRPFTLHDDMKVMQAMGLHQTTLSDLASWLPRDILDYCMQHDLLDHCLPTTTATSNTTSV